MGLRLTLTAFLVLTAALPASAQQDPAEEQQGQSRAVKIAHVLSSSGLVLSALEYGHTREICTDGACARERRKGYAWGAAIGLTGAAIGYTWVAANKRSSVRISPAGVTAKLAW